VSVNASNTPPAAARDSGEPAVSPADAAAPARAASAPEHNQQVAMLR
jgi:hypothetical protein